MSKLTFHDVEQVAKTINVQLTTGQKSEILEMYPSEQRADPTGSWDLVIENCIYQVVD